MGGDIGPPVTLPGAVKALADCPQLFLILCGDKRQITPLLASLPDIPTSRMRIEHCEEQVTMDEKPTSALRYKRNSSMWRALSLVEQGEADACVSAGNTGALLAMSYYLLKTLPGIDRPALVSALPTAKREKVYLLDLGANVNCDAEILYQHAVMGAVLAEQVAGIAKPRVALLNVGEEQIKGNDKVKHAAQILAGAEGLNYIGYVEGNSIFSDLADVVVTDGFVGNVALKSCEGLAKLVLSEVNRYSNKNIFTRTIARIALPLLRRIYQRMNPDQYNGASLIGLRGIVVKSHGNANSEAFYVAIREAMQQVDQQVPSKIRAKIETLLLERG